MGLYGPDGTLQQYVRAGQALHKAVEKMRGPTEAEVEAVARAIAQHGLSDTYDAFDMTGEPGQAAYISQARAAIVALDEARKK